MFETQTNRSRFTVFFSVLEVIYHATVFSLRRTHTNAVIGLLLNIVQTMMLVAVFYLMFVVLGLRSSAIRGDFLLYILSGIFMFMANTKTLQAVYKTDGPTAAMMQHGPMNTLVSIVSAALGALYTQILSVTVVLTVYSLAFKPVEIYDMSGTFLMLLLAWFNGAAIGVVFLALKPWFPKFSSIATRLYTRANMFASGKMFVANAMPGYVLVMFTWNPLFHIIDQARGFAFINYNPHYSNWLYPLVLSFVLLFLGLMGESHGRRHASISWNARG
ncbi:ABC transporter permease [uncultured Aliiroseovarius sp.]|uniref:ABC transporter permease n=1 Tax=uncultured Aliiroseovarius sp. TaxID=1658783 RepID=UPI0026337410|nr:ABC transporter permease [uncultured Aliiroseovarius sp.]